MAKAKAAARDQSLGNPAQLTSFEPDDADSIVVIIETPKGSRNKYAFDPEERIFCLKKMLPAGMTFPYDFGHVDDLGSKFEEELEQFFVNYHQLSGTKFRVLGLKGPAQGRRCVKAASKAAGRGARSK